MQNEEEEMPRTHSGTQVSDDAVMRQIDRQNVQYLIGGGIIYGT